MAKTTQGMVPDSAAYEKILYVSKDRLEDVSKLLKSGKASQVTPESIDKLMVPEDLAGDALLVPVDISVDAFGEIYDGHEELVETLGAKAVAEAVIEAATLFETTKANFKESERPIPMTVAEWKAEPCDDDTDEEEQEDDAEDDGQEEGEEEGEEEDAVEDGEEDGPASKKAKTA